MQVNTGLGLLTRRISPTRHNKTKKRIGGQFLPAEEVRQQGVINEFAVETAAELGQLAGRADCVFVTLFEMNQLINALLVRGALRGKLNRPIEPDFARLLIWSTRFTFDQIQIDTGFRHLLPPDLRGLSGIGKNERLVHKKNRLAGNPDVSFVAEVRQERPDELPIIFIAVLLLD